MRNVLAQLNHEDPSERLAALQQLLTREVMPPVLPQFANNHIHTTYSFSPYSPTAAIWFAGQAGLQTAGIMDHDSLGGAEEFIRAGELASIATTIGIECRVSLANTPFENRRVNNPDQTGNAYMALHGVPHTQIAFVQSVFAPLREKRNERNRRMVENINRLMGQFGIALDFDKEVLPTSLYEHGGTVTERHLLFALGKKIVAAAGEKNIISFLERDMELPLSGKQKECLAQPDSGYFLYDILGILKAGLVERVYVPADDECMHVLDLSRLAKQTGAIFCYAYLGDVTDSVTGDKKTQKFEDDFIEQLFDELVRWDVRAVTYMPSRNTPAQLQRVQTLCRERSLTEISGEDINSPRQKFICEQLAQPQFSHLIEATWNLIRAERTETQRQLKEKHTLPGGG